MSLTFNSERRHHQRLVLNGVITMYTYVRVTWLLHQAEMNRFDQLGVDEPETFMRQYRERMKFVEFPNIGNGSPNEPA